MEYNNYLSFNVNHNWSYLLSIFLFFILSTKSNAESDIEYPVPIYSGTYSKELIDKGEYLVKAGDCISCHTDTTSENAKPFSGNLPMVIKPFGTFYTPNITADIETGIGSWSDNDFINALHSGQRPHRVNLYPVFPYIYFNRVSKEDLLAIKAYLFSIPIVKNEEKNNKLIWPINLRFLQWGWRLLFFYPDSDYFTPNSQQTEQWNRGAYLVEGLGHCSMCHTRVNLFGAPIKSQYLGGALIDGYYAPNITSAALTSYTIEEIVSVFKNGIHLGEQGRVIGPMREVNHNSLTYLTDDDLEAIAVYLKTVPPLEPTAATTSVITRKTAEDIYDFTCSGCHDTGIGGAPRLGDQANWAMRLEQSNGLPDLVKSAIIGKNLMPPKGTCVNCTDEQIRAVVEYMLIRSTSGPSYPKSIVVPTAPLPRMSSAAPEMIYTKVCAACHETKEHNAPVMGDPKAWKPLINKGVDQLFFNTLNGYNNMPAKGGCTWCTDKQVIDTIKYMIDVNKTEGDYSLW